jgi:hypothetical protein
MEISIIHVHKQCLYVKVQGHNSKIKDVILVSVCNHIFTVYTHLLWLSYVLLGVSVTFIMKFSIPQTHHWFSITIIRQSNRFYAKLLTIIMAKKNRRLKTSQLRKWYSNLAYTKCLVITNRKQTNSKLHTMVVCINVGKQHL